MRFAWIGAFAVLMLLLGCAGAGVNVKVWPPVSESQCADPSLLSEKHTQSECYAYFAAKKGNVSCLCSDVPASSKDDCLYSYALSKDSAAACDMMSNGSNKDDCYLNVAISAKDSSACAKIADQTKQKSCLRYSK